KTTSISGFLLLYALAKLKPLRRRSLRFATEHAVLANWLNLVAATARPDYPLAVHIARMRSLVKGYGENHARGQAQFGQRVVGGPRVVGGGNSGGTVEVVIKAAGAGEDGQALGEAIAEVGAANSAGGRFPVGERVRPGGAAELWGLRAV